ncbi:hypothetical protein [Massilia psychrophila]|uniref:Prolin-rich transmembrane protein n=1 Tax=Massilia psychrophila TaxID=1603353 RepID=A0A2G8T5C1_9BURK|nr:hypothetical protein [Massilia psychrophila]PIL41214.1 hypothetical protein CR103_03750 [Massilia psychrophila]GGE67525.1 hypothetical protein GCM10008020_09930 [Massilia psychrophila]
MMARHLLLGAALLVAAGFALFGDNSPSGAVVEPALRANAANAANAAAVPARAAQKAAAVTILRLEERTALVVAGEGSAGRDAFASHDWTPPPPKPPPPSPPPPPPPPSAPPLPFTFLGKAVSNGQWEVFLARGSETLIVRDKMVLDGVYRIDAIAPPGMTMTYLPLNQVQQLNIGVLD